MNEVITSVFGLLENLLNLLEVLLIVTALFITISETVGAAITYYQRQSWLLFAVVTITAIIKPGVAPTLILLIALLPALMAIIIRPLLHRATLAHRSTQIIDEIIDDLKMMVAPVTGWLLEMSDRFRRSQHATLEPLQGRRARVAQRLVRYREQEKDAEAEWQRRQTMENGIVSLLIIALLLLIAFGIPFVIDANEAPEFTPAERIGLAVSLALHLIGLYNMVFKRDIISQVIGLLIMDHGLYLAVVKLVEIPVPATFFVISLYSYTLITIIILLVLLPQVRAQTESIDLDMIAANSDLRSEVGSHS